MPKRDPAKEQYWRRWVRQWQRSSLSGRAFCAAHGLCEPSFYSWRREIARRDQQQATCTKKIMAPSARAPAGPGVPAFLKVTLDAAAPAPAIEVVLAQGRRLQVRPCFDANLLRQLLHLLEEPPC